MRVGAFGAYHERGIASLQREYNAAPSRIQRQIEPLVEDQGEKRPP